MVTGSSLIHQPRNIKQIHAILTRRHQTPPRDEQVVGTQKRRNGQAAEAVSARMSNTVAWLGFNGAFNTN